jgi:pSer/pThr/pTyr-binding forkhead associated (FHA) protein
MFYQLVPSESESHQNGSWRLTLPATIGRGSESTICIDDESISRVHCQLSLATDESLQVRDLGSTNGTYVNGNRIRQHHSLFPGDVLQLGSLSLKVEYSSDTDPGPMPRKPRTPSQRSTQPIKTMESSTFTMHEVSEPAKRWWEFWKP